MTEDVSVRATGDFYHLSERRYYHAGDGPFSVSRATAERSDGLLEIVSADTDTERDDFTELPQIGESKADDLYSEGYRSFDDLRGAADDDLATIVGEQAVAAIRRHLDDVDPDDERA